MATAKKIKYESCNDKEFCYTAESKRAAISAASKDPYRWSKLELEKLELVTRTMYETDSIQIGMGVHFVKGRTGDRYEFEQSTICFRVYQRSAGKYIVARLA